MQGVLWHVRCTVTAFPQVPPPPTVFSLQVSVWLDSSFLLRLHSLYGEKSRRFSSTHPYQELCANQAPFLLCGRWWQGKGSGRTTGWLKMLTSAWHQSLLDCQLALASFTSSSHCSSIGTLVLQEGSRIHEVGWANMFTDHLLIDRLCFPLAIARSVKPRSSERSRRVFARPTLRILSSCSFLSLISATPTTRRHTRSLVTLMACVSCRILKPSLPTHWHVPLKQSKVVVWWFFFSRVWALLSNCTPWRW